MAQRFDKSATTQAYTAVRGAAERLEEEALYILKGALKDSGLKIDNIEHRVKDLESTLRKCESRNAALSEVADIVGLRVIALFRSDLARLEAIVRENFDVLSVENKVHDTAESFGYMSVHCECQLGKQNSGRRYDGLHGLRFEIQLRTICMHAWAAVSHHLEYKQERDVPLELRKELNALSGLFYVADSQFESAYNARVDSKAAAVAQASTPAILTKPLNLDTFTAYLAQRFSDRDQPTSSDASEVLSEMLAAGIADVKTLDEYLNASESLALEHEEEFPPILGMDEDGNETELDEDDDGRFAAVGIVRVALQIADPEFRVQGEFQDPSLDKLRSRLPAGFLARNKRS